MSIFSSVTDCSHKQHVSFLCSLTNIDKTALLQTSNNYNKRSLNNISQSIRFFVTGFVSQIIFMTCYNLLISTFEPMGHPASKIYAIFYTMYIPVGHALTSLFVFGWPTKYLPSLLANAPIGLTAMALGTALTGFLSKVEFNAYAEDLISSVLGMEKASAEDEEGEFYSSLVVMVATGLWSVVLSFVVNSEKKTDVKEKEL